MSTALQDIRRGVVPRTPQARSSREVRPAPERFRNAIGRYKVDRSADCAGCGLTCKFCWERRESILEGREPGEFLSPVETAGRILALMKENKVRQARLSAREGGGGE